MKTLPKFTYGRQFLDDSDIQAVTEALKADYITTGPLVKKFENELANYFSCKHVTVCNSGTSALYIASKVLGVCSNSVVIVPSQTFLATASVPHLLGAEVVFCDVDPISGLVTEEELTVAIQKCNKLYPKKRLQAIYVVHLNGHPAKVSELSKLASACGAYLIEDACHAIGGHVAEKADSDFYKVGSCKWSDAATFSFHPVKNLTTGEGGAVAFKDNGMHQRAEIIRNHGIDHSTSSDIKVNTLPVGQWSYFLQDPSLNFRIPDILCALGINQLRKLDTWIERRSEIYSIYKECLEDLEHVSFIKTADWAKPAWHLAAMHVDFHSIKKTKYHFFEELEAAGIKSQVHYQPVHLQPYWVKRYGHFDLLGASSYFSGVLSLPLFIGLQNEDVNFVVQNLRLCITRRHR